MSSATDECSLDRANGDSLLVICSDQTFLSTHSLTADRLLKLFVRVKERIVPSKCSHTVMQTKLEIKLVKEHPHGAKWGRLEPSEYSESRPATQLTAPTTPPSSPVSATSNQLASNKGQNQTLLTVRTKPKRFLSPAIPLPPPPPPLPPTSAIRQVRIPPRAPLTSMRQRSVSSQINTHRRRRLLLRSIKRVTTYKRPILSPPHLASLVFTIPLIRVL